MLAKILIVAMLASGGTTTLTINVNATPGVQVKVPPPPVTDPNLLPALLGAGSVGTAGVIFWPRGHRLSACRPNVEPDQSAWKTLLKEADGRLCSVTRIPA